MVDDDPFGLTNDAGRTRIRPVSGKPTPAPQPQRDQPVQPVSIQRGDRNTSNALTAAFAPLLELAPALESAHPPAAPEELRVQLVNQVTACRDEAVRLGAAMNRADAAAWNVAATLDDIALNTPWGGNSSWPSQSLVATLYGDVDAGNQFYERLEELQRYPNRDPELLELTFLCLSLGFRGRYRVEGKGGHSSLAEVRNGTARLLRNPERDAAPLAPNWEGVLAPNEPPRFAVPLWAIGIAALAVTTVIYVAMSINLTGRAERLYDLARLLPPPERAEIFRPVMVVEDAPEIPEFEPITFDLLPFFLQEAPPEVAGALSGDEDVSTTVLLIQASNPELFKSARADVNDGYGSLINSVAKVILANSELIGRITVVGHTDSIPVQRTNPFASNQGLSEARARRIAEILAASGIPPEIINFEGRAATEPIADNGTKEGRARNRRVEIKIQKRL